jgi:glycosyltransferase involved in cell wall biosynthesis
VRICAVTSFPPTVTGVADYGHLLVEEFARIPRVEHITVVADRAAGALERETADRLEIRRVWSRDGADVFSAIDRAIATSRADVVWFNLGLTMFGTRPTAVTAMFAPLAARLRGRRTVVTLHEVPALADLGALGIGRIKGRLAGAGILRVLLGADAVVVTLERYRAHLERALGAGNVTHIALGVWDASERADEPAEDTVLVFGTFGPHKDPGLVARAVARLRESGRAVRLVVAGADHPRHPGYMQRCRASLDVDAAWHGYVPRAELPSLFAGATVVAVPAYASTGSSGVIHRAIGHGRAVLASDLPDFRALAQEEDLALDWYAPGDADGLAHALGALLADRARRDALVRHNLRSLARLSPRRTAEAYLATFAPQTAVRTPIAEPTLARLAVKPVTDA